MRKDLRTLRRFRQNDIHYARAIYLFFGGIRLSRLMEVISEDEFASLPPVELWVHEHPGVPATLLHIIERQLS